MKFTDYERRFKGEVYFYGNASHGLWEALVWIQKHRPVEQPNVVMPVYIPEKLYRMVLAAGYEPKFYEIDEKLKFDISQVAGLIDSDTQAVVGIHYFGIPADIEDLKLISDQAGIFLIEDCAHTINSRLNGMELGTFGDIALFSVRKMLQLPAGGIMIINNKPWEFEPSYKKRVNDFYIFQNLLKTRSKYLYLMLSKGHDVLHLSKIYENPKLTIQQMSRAAKDYTYYVDLEAVAEKRRKNYQYLYKELTDLHILKPIWPANGNVDYSHLHKDMQASFNEFVPFSLPIIVDSAIKQEIRQVLQIAGVVCGAGWPEIPFGLPGFKKTKLLSESLLELPIHQGINKYQLEKISALLHQFEKNIQMKRIRNSSHNNEIKVHSKLI